MPAPGDVDPFDIIMLTMFARCDKKSKSYKKKQTEIA